ncbi:hypothetical protein ENKO_445 [Klebsiella phage fENko-Kae01]|nr:hypothetical protein [Klebsiella phage fENko-Kae01]
MITKDDFYEFLKAFYNKFRSAGEYFNVHPYNEFQRKEKEYHNLCDELGFYARVSYNTSPHAHNIYGMYGIDFRDLITLGYIQNKEYYLEIRNDEENPTYLTPDDSTFEKIAKAFIYGQGKFTILPDDVITIGDVSLTVFEIHKAIEEYSVPHRLKKIAIDDLYVFPSKGDDYSFGVGERYTEEYCDMVEDIDTRLSPYFFSADGIVNADISPEHQRYSWDTFKDKIVDDITDMDAVWICKTKPDVQFNVNIDTLKNLISSLVKSKNPVAGLLMIRVLTQNKITINYTDVPEFKVFVEQHGQIMRELRTMH